MSDERDPDQPPPARDETPDPWDRARAVVDAAIVAADPSSEPIVSRPLNSDSWANPNDNLLERPGVFAAACQGSGLFAIGMVGWSLGPDIVRFGFSPELLFWVLFVGAICFCIHLIPAAIVAWNVNATVIVRVSGRIRTPLVVEAMLTGLVNSLLIGFMVIVLGVPIREILAVPNGAGLWVICWYAGIALTTWRLSLAGAWGPMTAWTGAFVGLELLVARMTRG